MNLWVCDLLLYCSHLNLFIKQHFSILVFVFVLFDRHSEFYLFYLWIRLFKLVLDRAHSLWQWRLHKSNESTKSVCLLVEFIHSNNCIKRPIYFLYEFVISMKLSIILRLPLENWQSPFSFSFNKIFYLLLFISLIRQYFCIFVFWKKKNRKKQLLYRLIDGLVGKQKK